ncbi:MAG: hypothetical protein OXN17_07815 [Candidatus Poribacteria bacterium]|nr:hypothetical protein [Candidatus Poribacteria bacterium]MDE0504413.1 hypothetical protein [Candidatus Poribacteria bacterium]
MKRKLVGLVIVVVLMLGISIGYQEYRGNELRKEFSHTVEPPVNQVALSPYTVRQYEIPKSVEPIDESTSRDANSEYALTETEELDLTMDDYIDLYLAQVQEEIEVIKGTPTVKNETDQTLQDLWQSAGLSINAISKVMELIPIDPTINLKDFESMLESSQVASRAIDNHLKSDAATLTLEEARGIVKILKDDPTTTAEEFQYITKELFPTEIQATLVEEGVL